jgi:hypothetical protein
MEVVASGGTARGMIVNSGGIDVVVGGGGLTSSTGKRFTVTMIRWIRYKHRVPSPPLPAGTFNVNQVRKRYGDGRTLPALRHSDHRRPLSIQAGRLRSSGGRIAASRDGS